MPTIRINKKDWTDEQWLRFRLGGIGSSDAPVVAGFGRFDGETPYQLWLTKTGQAPARDLSENPYVRWGKIHEASVARVFQEDHPNWAVRKTNFIYANDDYGFPMLANLDRLVRRPGESTMPLEIKTTGVGDGWGESGTSDIPEGPYLQVQHQLATLPERYDRGMCAVLIRGNDYREYVIPRDEAVIADLIAIERDFWQKVVTQVAPPAMTEEDVRIRWPKTSGNAIDAVPEIERVVRRLRRLKAIEQRLDERDELRAQLGEFMGEADTLKVAGQVALTYKTQTANRLDTKALEADLPLIVAGYKRPSLSRVLRLK